MRTKQQYICRRARRQICCAEKALQSFTSADVKAVKSVFCRDMRALQRGFSCPLRGNSPSGRKHFTRSERRIVRYKRTIEAQSAANPFRKSGFATFSTVSKRRPRPSLFSWLRCVGRKMQKSGIISQVLLYNREKLCYHNSARLSCAFPHLGRGGFTGPPLSVGRI